MKRIRGKQQPLTGAASGLRFLLSAFAISALFHSPARACVAETLTLERTLSDLVNQAHGLTLVEIDLMWKTAPPRMPIPPPAS